MFPKNFYWGASTSAHQVEGGLTNNWSKWELKHSKEASEHYKNNRPHWYKMSEENYKDACHPDNYISGIACDSYNQYKEDVKVLKELGLNAYRFSVDWSRIEPKKGEFSEEGIQYYKKLVKELRKNNIEPFLTCWHWPIPLWLEEEGGLESKNIVKYFKRYVEFLVKNLGEDVKYWMTINEPIVISTASYLISNWPPQKRSIFTFNKITFGKLVDMHKEAYKVIKEYDANLQLGIAKNNSYEESYNNNPINKLITRVHRYFNNFRYLGLVHNHLDYIGLNFYFHNKIGIKGVRNDNDKVNDMGWWMKPKSIYYVIKEVWDRYHLPICITENGVADREDKYREWWLDKTMEALEMSLKEGVDLRGYMHWSLLDNFEWDSGYWPRFGLAARDRKIKDSGWYYKKLVEKYR
ncbi:MAG: family 1 glycosylhydrolase [Candidatus Dojkabacteria bacterium]|nr:family 1 glycosylhydrolase [Candidatus Dojkabacteria bacterium]